ARRTAAAAGLHAVRRRAADAGPGPRADGGAGGAPARRAVARPGPAGGRADHGAAGALARRDPTRGAARRAERAERPVRRRPGDRPQPRPGGARGQRRRHRRGRGPPARLPGVLAVREFMNLTLDGLTSGVIFAALALSLVLIWRSTRVINFAQGAMAMATTYIAISVIDRHWSWWVALAVALGAGFVMGAVVERVLVRPVE